MANRLDDDYNDIPKNPAGYAIISLFCGVVGVFIAFQLKDFAIAAVALGAVGLFLGGFAISVANHFPGKDRLQFMLLAGVGLMASVIAFMFGLVYAVD
jgi:CHASE2 domain-containing sensor protein